MRALLSIYRFVKPYRAQAILALVLLVGVVFSDLVIPRLTQVVVDRGIANRDIGMIVGTSVLMLVAAILSALFAIGNTIASVRVGESVGADVRSALVRKVQTFSFGNLDRIQTGQLLVRATSDVNQVKSFVNMSLRMLTRAPLWMLGSLVMLVATNAKLGLIILAMLPFIGGIIWIFLVKGQPLFMLVQKKLDRMNQVMQENLAGIRVIKAFVLEGHEKERFDRANTDYAGENIRVMTLISILLPTMTSFVNLGVVGVLWFGGQLTINSAFTVGEIIASINYVSYSIFPLTMLTMMVAPISAASASANRIMGVLQSEPMVRNNTGARPVTDGPGRVAFENVSFSYNGKADGDVLNGISFVAEPGETVAILGATGSGKSSLVNLIPRFYDVHEGRITLDGEDVRNVDINSLRSRVGMALQETVLFSGTIYDNICFGRPEASESEVLSAARAAEAHDFISAFPDGYKTLIGQRGVNLSGGQKQRIAIARALLVRPSVLILDDSTSAIDVETEARIQEALRQMEHERTCLIIAQRVSTVLDADKIIVLDGGRIVAEGTHDELIVSSPIYREIYESQLGSAPVNCRVGVEVQNG